MINHTTKINIDLTLINSENRNQRNTPTPPLLCTSTEPLQSWSTSITRPKSSLPSKDAFDMFQAGMKHKKSTQSDIQHNRIPISYQNNLTKQQKIILNSIHHTSPILDFPPNDGYVSHINSLRSSPIPRLRSGYIRSNSRFKTTKSQTSSTSSTTQSNIISFPSLESVPFYQNPSVLNKKKQLTTTNTIKNRHQRQQETKVNESKKVQQTLVEKYSNSDKWYELRQSLIELKRLASSQNILIDPTMSLFNCDGYSFSSLKFIMDQEQQQQLKNRDQTSDCGTSSSVVNSVLSNDSPSELDAESSLHMSSGRFRDKNKTSASITFQRPAFEPLQIGQKPIYTTVSKRPPKRFQRPLTAAVMTRRKTSTPTPPLVNNRDYLIVSDLSHTSTRDDKLVTPAPTMELPKVVVIDEENDDVKSLTTTNPIIPPPVIRPPSASSTALMLKLKSTPRCRSACTTPTHTNGIIEISKLNNKIKYRFILITDEEHRIESWYYQYPFMSSDDLLLCCSNNEQKQKNANNTIAAYFIGDETQKRNYLNSNDKLYLSGKPFHIVNDWKKYDLIFISNNVYDQIMKYLASILREKRIFQVNHDDDLKLQIKTICRNLQNSIVL